MEILITAVVAFFGGFVFGAFIWPHIIVGFAKLQASRAVTAATALIAKAEADAKALEAARAVVATKTVAAAASAAAVSVMPSGTTGPHA